MWRPRSRREQPCSRRCRTTALHSDVGLLFIECKYIQKGALLPHALHSPHADHSHSPSPREPSFIRLHVCCAPNLSGIASASMPHLLHISVELPSTPCILGRCMQFHQLKGVWQGRHRTPDLAFDRSAVRPQYVQAFISIPLATLL